MPESSRAEGVGRWAPTRSGRKGRGRAPEGDATSGMRRCPGSGRGGGEPGPKRRRPLSVTPRTAGERLRPAPSGGADCRPAELPGSAEHPEAAVHPESVDAPGGGGCTRGRWVHLGLVGAPGDWRIGGCSPISRCSRSRRVIPKTGSHAPRRRETGTGGSGRDPAGYLKRGESFRHSSKSTVIFILPPPDLAVSAR